MSTAVATDDTWKTLELTWSGGTINAEPAGWKLVGFDDSAWDDADIPVDPFADWAVISGADFIISQSRANDRLQSAVWVARKEFTLADDAGAARLLLTADNWCEVWIDGTLVASLLTNLGTLGDYPPNWEDANTVVVPVALLVAGTHCLAIKVRQDDADGVWTATPPAEINPTMAQARLDVLALAAGVFIDWDNDGFDVGAFDAIHDQPGSRIISWTITRGASAELTGGAQPGAATLTLKNPDDIYNPRNTSSPLYGLLRDGAPAWIGPNSDGKLTGDDPRGLFGGRITDITLVPAGGANGAPTVEIACEDALSWYQRTPVQVDYAEGRAQDALRAAALIAAGETRYSLDHEIHTMPLSHADGDLGSVLDSINAINGTRHLAKPEDAFGEWYRYTTRNRQHGLAGTADASLDAGSDHVTGTSGWRLSADTVTNQQRATVTPIVFTPGTFTVWEADVLPVEVTTTRPYSRIVEFDDVVTDAVLDIASTGATVTATMTTFATAAKIELSVASGTGVVTALSVEGRLARRLPNESHEANDTTSQAAPRGIREGSEIGNEYLGVIASARGIAEHVVWRYGNPQFRPTLTVVNWFPEQFELDLYDVISFTSSQLDMTARLFEIVGLTHEGRHAATDVIEHVTTYVLQESRVQAPYEWFTLDVSRLAPGATADHHLAY